MVDDADDGDGGDCGDVVVADMKGGEDSLDEESILCLWSASRIHSGKSTWGGLRGPEGIALVE